MYQDKEKSGGRGSDFSSLFRESNVEGYKRRRWRTKAIETK